MHHVQNKGLLFKGGAERQHPNTLSTQATVASLGKYSDVLYTSKEGGSSYATDSDSEITNSGTVAKKNCLFSTTLLISLTTIAPEIRKQYEMS